MRKISTKQDCEKLFGLTLPEKTFALLNSYYGDSRNPDNDLGGYVLLIENEQDFADFKKIFSEEINHITVEYADILFWNGKPTHTASLFLVSSDFSVLLMIPYLLTPISFFANDEQGKEG